MPISETHRSWYYNQIETLDPEGDLVTADRSNHQLRYDDRMNTDENRIRAAQPEELVRATVICLLYSKYGYEADRIEHEMRFEHGSRGSYSDKVDIIIRDEDDIPYALWELKSHDDYESERQSAIEYQLFKTAPLVGSTTLLVYATVRPDGDEAELDLECIEYSKHTAHDGWVEDGEPSTDKFPIDYRNPDYKPYKRGGERELETEGTQSEFTSMATLFHNEFFGEHPDNELYSNLVKCLLAKILDERQTSIGDAYSFQVFLRDGKEESADEIFERVNNLYKNAYARYIDQSSSDPDEINPRQFAPERVKTVVKTLQSYSLTARADNRGDVIGAFFEEIMRSGFKQDKGMYFTHDNLVEFILEAVDVKGLTEKKWENASHPDQRLPYIIDPACGSGTFLLRAMQKVTSHIRSNTEDLVTNLDDEDAFSSYLSDSKPNEWAKDFVYGLDPKFVMAITSKVNMVLHGDGSAHIYKHDAFKPLSSFEADKFHDAGEHRSVPRTRYDYDVCESFDLVVSNPPFGINLAAETKSKVSNTYSLKSTSNSESLFLERCHQLLKPGGRLAVVLPESLLNTTDSANVRLLLYRFFNIKSIVALPRNVFIDTPTLTSLLFAQKKTEEEVDEWDTAWQSAKNNVDQKVSQAKNNLRSLDDSATTSDVQRVFLDALSPVVDASSWIRKGGANPEIMSVDLPSDIDSVDDAVDYYERFLGYAGFDDIKRNYIFESVASELNYDFQVFQVDEVGYKLSRRSEQTRPNQLCNFVSQESNSEVPNLHLTNDSVSVEVDDSNPRTILDYIASRVEWN